MVFPRSLFALNQDYQCERNMRLPDAEYLKRPEILQFALWISSSTSSEPSINSSIWELDNLNGVDQIRHSWFNFCELISPTSTRSSGRQKCSQRIKSIKFLDF